MNSKLVPSASIYVGDLVNDCTEGTLFDIFNMVGSVASIRVCRDTLTRRSLGYAYINFHSVVDAERALDTLNNTPINGVPCRIMWVQRDPTMRKSGLGNIFIKNLDPTIGHKELHDTFSIFGNILSCKVVLDENAQSKGYGFVHFENVESADIAVKMVNGKVLRSKKVYVGKFISKKEFAKQKESSWTNVYIKDIDPSTTEEELRQIFLEKVGVEDPKSITSCVIMKNKNQTPRGFGFVNFASHELAVKAVEALQNVQIGGKNIWCGRAQKFQERQQELKKKFEQLKMERINKYLGTNLYIKNIEDQTTEEQLTKEFSPFGTIRSCKIMVDENGKTRGFGFICYTFPEEAQQAIGQMHGKIIEGCQKPLYVALHEPQDIRKQKLALRNSPKQGIYYPMANYGSPMMFQQMSPQTRNSPYTPNYYQQSTPNRGGRSNGNGRGRGRGGRGQGRRQHQHSPASSRVMMQDPSILHASQAQPFVAGFTLEQLMSLPEDQQKLALGEALYTLIYKSQPTLSGKITGMFLDAGWPVEELYALLEDQNKLSEKIEQALQVLSTPIEPMTQQDGVQPQAVEAH